MKIHISISSIWKSFMHLVCFILEMFDRAIYTWCLDCASPPVLPSQLPLMVGGEERGERRKKMKVRIEWVCSICTPLPKHTHESTQHCMHDYAEKKKCLSFRVYSKEMSFSLWRHVIGHGRQILIHPLKTERESLCREKPNCPEQSCHTQL